jgi:thiamine kinase
MIASELLLHVPGCENGRPPLAATRLNELTKAHSVWRVRTTAGEFVLRRRVQPMMDVENVATWELKAHQFAATAGLAPQVVAAAPDGSWMVTDYLPVKQWDEQQLLKDAGIDALSESLARLHRLPVPNEWPTMDANRIATNYANQLQATAKHKDFQLAVLITGIARLSAEIEQSTEDRSLNHGDLVVGNIIGQRPWLIDWEFAQVTHATYDIACLLTYYPQLQAQKSRLLAATGLNSPDDRALLALQCERFAGLNQLWTAIYGTETG